MNFHEYSKGEIGTPLSLETLEKMKSNSRFLTHFFRDNQPVNIFYYKKDSSRFFIIEYINKIIGYFWTEKITNKIFQIKNAFIFDPYKNKGIGSECYITLINNAGVKFIHDTQLSDVAEYIWKNKLPSLGLIKGIYDRKINTIYS